MRKPNQGIEGEFGGSSGRAWPAAGALAKRWQSWAGKRSQKNGGNGVEDVLPGISIPRSFILFATVIVAVLPLENFKKRF